MNKIIILVGLTGCGKTTYGNSIMDEKSFFIDDIKSIDEIKVASSFETVILADPHLCIEKSRKSLIKYLNDNYPEVEIEFKYWENNLDKCWENVKLRNDGRIIDFYFAKYLSENYNPPKIDFLIKQRKREPK
jgi:ABC-type dipeptide/oligopeptide/nickel transport system ATPase component